MRTSQEALLADIQQVVDDFRLLLRGRTTAEFHDINRILQIQLEDLKDMLILVLDRHYAQTLSESSEMDEEDEDTTWRILRCISSTVQKITQSTESLQFYSRYHSIGRAALLRTERRRYYNVLDPVPYGSHFLRNAGPRIGNMRLKRAMIATDYNAKGKYRSRAMSADSSIPIPHRHNPLVVNGMNGDPSSSSSILESRKPNFDDGTMNINQLEDSVRLDLGKSPVNICTVSSDATSSSWQLPPATPSSSSKRLDTDQSSGIIIQKSVEARPQAQMDISIMDDYVAYLRHGLTSLLEDFFCLLTSKMKIEDSMSINPGEELRIAEHSNASDPDGSLTHVHVSSNSGKSPETHFQPGEPEPTITESSMTSTSRCKSNLLSHDLRNGPSGPPTSKARLGTELPSQPQTRLESVSDGIGPVVSCTPEARSSYIMKERSTKSKKDACTACFDAIQPRQPHFKAPCSHMYCKDCGVKFVASYTSQEPLYPFRCCNIPIPQNEVRPILSSAQFNELLQRDKEYRTPVRRRVYCPNTSCKQFIKVGKMASYLSIIRKIKCPSCTSWICTKCRQLAHKGSKCDGEKVNTIKFEALVKKKGWQRCQKCHRVVEKAGGCSHMTCVCGYDFCYRCGPGPRGKTCKHGVCLR